jgi:hypothetical protein
VEADAGVEDAGVESTSARNSQPENWSVGTIATSASGSVRTTATARRRVKAANGSSS